MKEITPPEGKPEPEQKPISLAAGGAVVLLALVVVAAVFMMAGADKVTALSASAKATAVNTIMKQVADQTNATLPVMVDSETRLDATAGLDGRFRYEYTTVNVASTEVSPRFEVVMRERLVDLVCTSSEMAVFRDHDITVTYAYYGNDEKPISEIDVVPSTCVNAPNA